MQEEAQHDLLRISVQGEHLTIRITKRFAVAIVSLLIAAGALGGPAQAVLEAIAKALSGG